MLGDEHGHIALTPPFILVRLTTIPEKLFFEKRQKW